MDEPLFNREKLIPKVKAILKAWINVQDMPTNYDEPKTESGKLLKTVNQRGLEREFWRMKYIELIGEENMRKHYDELDKKLTELGFKK